MGAESGTDNVNLVARPMVPASSESAATGAVAAGEVGDSSMAGLVALLPAKGSLLVGFGNVLACSFALNAASSFATFAAALAPSGPHKAFPQVRSPSEGPVERVTMGASLELGEEGEKWEGDLLPLLSD